MVTIVALKLAMSLYFPLPKHFALFVPTLSNGTGRTTSDRKPKTNDQILPSPIVLPIEKMNQINTKNYWKKKKRLCVIRPSVLLSFSELKEQRIGLGMIPTRASFRFFLLLLLFYTLAQHQQWPRTTPFLRLVLPTRHVAIDNDCSGAVVVNSNMLSGKC